jgi:hypothetical protein
MDTSLSRAWSPLRNRCQSIERAYQQESNILVEFLARGPHILILIRTPRSGLQTLFLRPVSRLS